MNLQDILAVLPAEVKTGADRLHQQVTGAYVSDLLSNVMGQAQAGSVWVTMQGHQNIVAVASLLGLSGIILAGGVCPEDETVRKAEREGVVLILTKLPMYETACKLYSLGISGQ